MLPSPSSHQVKSWPRNPCPPRRQPCPLRRQEPQTLPGMATAPQIGSRSSPAALWCSQGLWPRKRRHKIWTLSLPCHTDAGHLGPAGDRDSCPPTPRQQICVVVASLTWCSAPEASRFSPAAPSSALHQAVSSPASRSAPHQAAASGASPPPPPLAPQSQPAAPSSTGQGSGARAASLCAGSCWERPRDLAVGTLPRSTGGVLTASGGPCRDGAEDAAHCSRPVNGSGSRFRGPRHGGNPQA